MDDEKKAEVRKELEAEFTEVMNTEEATDKYEFLSFMAPFAVVKDRATGQKGMLEFIHMPRFYFNFQEIR